LETVDTTFPPLETDTGDKTAAGAELTKRLSRETDCRNVLWLSQWGSDVVSRPTKLVIDVELGKLYNAKVISFPRTFVLHKDKSSAELCRLIRSLTEGAITRLQQTDAISLVQPSRITQLFTTFFKGTGSVKHYFDLFQDADELQRRRLSLGKFDLLTHQDPPMTFSTWLRAYKRPDQLDLHEFEVKDTTKFVQDLIRSLGDHLWGLRVRDLPGLVRRAIGESDAKKVDLSQLDELASSTSDKVIGPVVRQRLITAVVNAIQNAMQNTPPEGRVWLECRRHEGNNALDFLVLNEVANADEVRRELDARAQHRSLRGITEIRAIIEELNDLHPKQATMRHRRACSNMASGGGTRGEKEAVEDKAICFGAWGLLLLVSGKAVYAKVKAISVSGNEETGREASRFDTQDGEEWFRTGVSMSDLEEACRNDDELRNTVVLAIRMPLVTHEELSKDFE
jgi:hypothetical protein